MKKSDQMNLVGYFAIANKPLEIEASALSKTMRRKINNHGTFNLITKRYVVLAILIAQFGKNFSEENQKQIRGDELMRLTLEKVKSVQSDVGSRFVYVECENKSKLIRFYENHGFVIFGSRETTYRSESCDRQLVQLLKYIH